MVFIRSVKPLENFLVRLVFSDGEQKDNDVDRLIKGIESRLKNVP